MNNNYEKKKVFQVLLFIYVSNSGRLYRRYRKRLRHGPDYPYSDLKMELNTSGMAALLLGCWLQKERESRRERGREKGGEWEGERGVRGWEKRQRLNW